MPHGEHPARLFLHYVILAFLLIMFFCPAPRLAGATHSVSSTQLCDGTPATSRHDRARARPDAILQEVFASPLAM